jgi:hypothetical protein
MAADPTTASLPGFAGLRDRRTAWLLAAALVVLTVVPQFLSRTIPDTAWLLYSAGRALDGATLYVDVVDVNPPLIVWLNMPAVLVARALGLSEILVYRVMVLLQVLGSVAVCGWLLRRYLASEDAVIRRYLVLVLLFAMLTLVREDYGEREHVMLALVMPYVLLTVARAEGHAVSRVVALPIGLAAGIGVALKPYFVVLWVGLEAALLLLTHGRRSTPRIESLAVVTVGVLYLAAVFTLTPEYLTVVRMMSGPYYVFLHNSLPITALLGDGAALPLGAILGWVALRRFAGRPVLWTVLLAAIVAFYASAVLQHKGWRYHYYPALATAFVLFGVMALDLRRPLRTFAARLYALAAVAVIISVPAFTALASIAQALDPKNSRYDADPDLSRLVPVVRDRAAGGSAMVLSWHMASAFPLLTYSEVATASRFNTMWMLAAVYWDQLMSDAPLRYREPERMGELERYLNDAVVEDLERERPRVLLVLRPAPDRREWRLRRLDFLEYFGRDPRFAGLFERYQYGGTVGQYWVFDRLPDGAPPAAPRRRVPEQATSRPAVLPKRGSGHLETDTVMAALVFLAALVLAIRYGRAADAVNS